MSDRHVPQIFDQDGPIEVAHGERCVVMFARGEAPRYDSFLLSSENARKLAIVLIEQADRSEYGTEPSLETLAAAVPPNISEQLDRMVDGRGSE